MKKRAYKVIFYSAVLFALGCAYAFFADKTGIYIPCVFRLITGLKCPGCGISHMAVALIHLDFKTAWNENPALMLMLPLFVYLAGAKTFRYIKLNTRKEPKHETVIQIIMLAALILFGIVRNIPQFM